MIGRVAAGALLATAIALLARRAGSLSASGAAAAAAVGTAAVAAGWAWSALLILYFVSSSVLSRAGRDAKAQRVGDIVEKGSERDAAQVLANGGVFAAAALGAVLFPAPLWGAVGAGALAASAADTWATEVGTLLGGSPRGILTGRVLPAGASGGVTLAGSAASIAGAVAVAAAALGLGWPPAQAAGAAAGGVAGSLADSVLGATAQERRWCDRCEAWTERRTHGCGAATAVRAGVPGVRNDLVNLAATAAGASVAFVLASTLT